VPVRADQGCAAEGAEGRNPSAEELLDFDALTIAAQRLRRQLRREVGEAAT
jgi:hypothetical protein